MRKLMLSLGAIVSAFAAGPSSAWDAWPCEVVLCLANPAGPMAAPACVPPISRLWVEMTRPRFRLPTCEGQAYPDFSVMQSDLQKVLQNHAAPTLAEIQAGMTQTPVATPLPASVANVVMTSAPFDPCEGGRTQVIAGHEDGAPSAECRGPLLGYLDDGDGGTVAVYEGYRQLYQPGLAFDVYISGQLWQRVRPNYYGGGAVVSFGGASGVSHFGAMPAAQAPLYFTVDAQVPATSTLARSEASFYAP